MNVQHVMSEACNDGIPESESDVHRLSYRPADMGRDCLISVADRQATNAVGEPFEKGISA
jgi:hypothetical protein